MPRAISPLTLAVVLSVATAQAASPPSPLWGALEPGPHAVGLEVRTTHDLSRSFRVKRDLEGRVRHIERHRPIQVVVWYPARGADGGAGVTFGDYLALTLSELDPSPPSATQVVALRNRFVTQREANGARRGDLERLEGSR